MATQPFPARPHPRVIDGAELPEHGFGMSLEDVRQLFFGVASVCLLYTETPFYPPIPVKTRGKSVYGTCRSVSSHQSM